MGLKKLKQKRWFRILSNKYLLISLVFVVWMFFFDSNSWLVHRELDHEIDKLKSNEKYYRQEIDSDRAIINQLKDDEGLERYAREKYFMKREDEEIFIIEYQDSNLTKKRPKK
ncbi:MAG TPA: septum formation initiator family protein [Flavobacteriaceae bacterium]|nr:septum formation initiator family protein [Flavobacteriaceae bacterium]